MVVEPKDLAPLAKVVAIVAVGALLISRR
jgi:hypothetical protein